MNAIGMDIKRTGISGMRVAFVSPHPLFPTISGNRERILTLVRSVRALGHDVSFFYIVENAAREGFNETLLQKHQEELGKDNFFIINLGKTKARRSLERALLFWKTQKFKRIFDNKNSFYRALDEDYYNFYSEQISRFTESKNFDVVFCEYIFTSKAFEAFPENVLKVIDTHDSFGDRHKKFLHLKNGATAYWMSIPPGEEVRAFRRADVIVAIQEDEAEDFRARLGSSEPEVVTISHFISIPTRTVNYDSADAIFIGSDNSSNVISIKWFIDNVIPIIREEFQNFKLHLVGKVCSEIEDSDFVVKHYFMDDISESYKFGSISVNPTLLGTGINIKLLDAMAAGAATVTTHFGAQRLPTRFRSGVVVPETDDPAAFAREMRILVGDAAQRAQQGARARAAALEWNREQMASCQSLLARAPSQSQRQS